MIDIGEYALLKIVRRARFRALRWALRHTETGRALLFSEFHRGYKLGAALPSRRIEVLHNPRRPK